MAKKYIVTVNGTSYEVVVEDADPTPPTPRLLNLLRRRPRPLPPLLLPPRRLPLPQPPATGKRSPLPLPGTVLKVLAKQGAAVKSGDVLCIIEAMKMENEIMAPCDGTVSAVSVSEGASVNAGDPLFVIS